jgi:hypothetical protein
MPIPFPSTVTWIPQCAFGGDLGVQCNFNKSNGKSCYGKCKSGWVLHPPGSSRAPLAGRPLPIPALVGCNLIYRCEVVECGAIPMLYLISPPWFCRATDEYTRISPFDMDKMPSFSHVWTSPDTWTVFNCGCEFCRISRIGAETCPAVCKSTLRISIGTTQVPGE